MLRAIQGQVQVNEVGTMFTKLASSNFLSFALAALLLWISDTSVSFSQEFSLEKSLARLYSKDAETVVDEIESLTPESLHNDQIIEKLVLLLDDERVVKAQMFESCNLRDRVQSKLCQLDSSLVTCVSENLPKLETTTGIIHALYCVGCIGTPNTTSYKHLLPYGNHLDPLVRCQAVYALRAVAEPKYLSRLGTYLSDLDPNVRWAALTCMMEHPLYLHKRLPVISRMLEEEFEICYAISNHAFSTRKLRQLVAQALAAIGPSASDTLPKLTQLVDASTDMAVRAWSAAAICKISSSPPPEMLDRLGELLLREPEDEWADDAVVDAIAALGDRGRTLMDHLERAKRHKSTSIRLGVVRAFFAIDPVTAVERSLPLVQDADGFCAGSVTKILMEQKASGSELINALVLALKRHKDIFDEPASSAVEALRQNGGDARSALQALIELGSDENASEDLRQAARNAAKAIKQQSL